jgi:hypothetical protein
MNYAILRVAKRSLGQASAMARHALREMNTPNADPARLRENTIVGPRKAAEVVAQLRSRTELLVKRKDAVRVVELFIGASPEAMAKLSREQQDAYFADALKWTAAKFGGDRANIVFAAVHRDESTPHMQVLLTPIVGGKLAANQVLGGPAGLVKLQDEFAAKVGAKHGLRRGERGSRAKHTSVRQFYAALQAAGSVDAIPLRRPVPPAPAELTMFASAEVKRAHAKATAERAAAIEANKKRERTIEGFARLGLATHGRGRRRLPGRLSQVEQLEAATSSAVAVTREAQELLGKLDQAQRAEVLAKAKERLAKEAVEKAAKRPQEPSQRVPGPTTRPRVPRPR